MCSVFALCLLLLFSGCERPQTVVVSAEPEDAVLWVNEELIGPVPQKVIVPRDREVRLRVSRPAYEDATPFLRCDDLPPDRRLHVQLARQQSLSLRCVSHPSGANVFLNGEFRGTTPLDLAGLEPGVADLVFRMEQREQVTRTVDLNPGRREHLVTVDLPSRTAGYYEQQIQDDPKNMANYVDLAHHYMLEKRFTDTMDVFRKGIRIALDGSGTGDIARLWSEIQRVTQRQYDYGDAEDVKQSQRLLRTVLAEAVKQFPGAVPEVYANYILVLDALGDRRKAQDVFIEAWRRYPHDRGLQRMRKQMGFRVY